MIDQIELRRLRDAAEAARAARFDEEFGKK